MDNYFTDLNDRQKEAVGYLEGPLLILAGAGSGKTRALTCRIGKLIENGVAPWHILAITFTNKAAGEMRERVNLLLNSRAAEQVFVSTFHSMCVRLLRQDIDKLGYQRDFTIYDTDDQKTLVRSCIKTLELDTRMYRERAVLSVISASKNEMVDAGAFQDAAGDFYERNVGRIFAEYEKQLRKNNALDFDDLLVKTVELFRQFPEVLEKWQDRFRYIMVDEYQDTNNVQFELVRLLSEKYKNLCVVGDDDQSIYKFRGANIENILSFERSFPGARVIKLEQNYRSTQSILRAANEVISNNRGRKDKRLWTENPEGELPVYQEYETAAGEAEHTILKAAQLHARGTAYSDQAVLYRTNAQSRLLEEKCIERNIPYIIVGGVNFYQRKEIKDMLSYLRVIANASDDLACQRIINVPKRGIGQTSVDRVNAFAAQNGIGFYEALCRPSNIPGIGTAAKKLQGFTSLIEDFRTRLKEGELGLQGLIEAVREETGYEEELRKDDPVTAQTRLENIEELINKAVSFEMEKAVQQAQIQDGQGQTDAAAVPEEDGLERLGLFLEEISLVADIDRTNDSDDVLKLMTLHAAKGLEFDTVYLCGMEEGLFPSSASINAADPEAEIEEERRLCYVGFTRARKKLFLSSAKERMVNGDMRYTAPSRFIDEIPDEAAEKHFLGNRGGSPYETYRKKDSFAGFGGYEGRMEYSLYNGFDIRSVGSFGSLDTTPAGKARGGRNAARGNGRTGSDNKGFGGGLASLQGQGISKGFGSIKGNTGSGTGSAAGAQPGTRPDYGPGDRVSHIKFGSGTVVSLVEGPKDYEVTVDFDEVGTKRMFAGFAKLRKL